MDLRDVQLLKVLHAIDVIDSDRVTFVKNLQEWKVLFPRVVTELGIVMERNELPLKAYIAIVTNDSGSLMERRDLQSPNALSQIDNRVDGNLIEDRLMQ